MTDLTDDELDAAVEALDDHGLTTEQRVRWRAMYTSIATMTEVALAEAPTVAEARRRLALLKLDLRTSEAAVSMAASDWTPGTTVTAVPPDAVPADTTPDTTTHATHTHEG